MKSEFIKCQNCNKNMKYLGYLQDSPIYIYWCSQCGTLLISDKSWAEINNWYIPTSYKKNETP